ncbi:unnamed protein product [Oreochromis niloticus]|nr:unnamed protein product [Mustela putorius furo]
MASTLTEEQFQCSICLYSFKNPVSIPCGHNFCLECIKRYWDVAHKSECPLCKESFRSRPELRRNKEREIQASVQAATMMVSAIERNQTLLIKEIERKQEVAEKRAEELLKEISQEIIELQKRRSELHLLEHIENPVQLQQNFLRLDAPMSVKHWADVRVQSDSYVGTVRRTFSKLVDICQELEKKLCAEVDVTLDPATAAGWVVLSPDNKKVSLSSQQWRNPLPDDPRRFNSCVAVLGKQSFTSGKRYWVVQVG